jgi:1A family penicillin-binding protein
VPQTPPRRSKRDQIHFITGRLLIFMTSVVLAGVIGCGAGLSASLAQLPDVSSLDRYVPHETSKIYDRKGHLIANVHGEENRVVIPLHDIPKFVQQAIIAMEDTDFYNHYGVDPKGITRALLVNVAEGGSVEGASTLTQQLAKNMFLEPAKTLPRKIAEAWLAIQIEHHYSKAKILEMYLNQVYWGHNGYGIEAAAQNYFGKSTRQLTLAESAMLAGILRGPEYFSPYRNAKGAKHLQELVIDRMVLAGFINRRVADAAKSEKLSYPGITSYAYKVPWFTTSVIKALKEKYGEDMVMKGGLRVHTTLDMDLQAKAEAMVKEAVAANKIYNIHQAALVAVEAKTGYVRAVVGGVDFNKSKFNRAVQALRPPGSTFKPFVYLAGLKAGYSPGTVVVDEPVSLPSGSGQYYSPNNYDHRFRGPITVRQALASSVNIVAIKIGYDVGIPQVIKTAQALGIKSSLGENLSLPLGTSEVTPYEMAGAYATLANDGVRAETTMVTKVLDRNGRVLEQHTGKGKRVYDANPVRLLTSMMEGVIQYGTATAAGIGRPAAGKTGTTSDARDVWFVGFTPELSCAVWMGNDDNSKLWYGSTGGAICAPLWSRFMRYAHRNVKPKGFPTANYTEAYINRRTGRPTSASDRDAVGEMFAPGLAPSDQREGEASHRKSVKAKAKKVATPEPIEMDELDAVPPPAARPAARPRPQPRPAKTKPPKIESIVTDETLMEPGADFPGDD